MIFGEGRPYNVCLLVPDLELLKKIAGQLQVKTEIDKVITSPVVQKFITCEVQTSLKGKYGGYEIPKKVRIIAEDFTLDNGMLTQTFKLKRRKVMDRHAMRLWPVIGLEPARQSEQRSSFTDRRGKLKQSWPLIVLRSWMR